VNKLHYGRAKGNGTRTNKEEKGKKVKEDFIRRGRDEGRGKNMEAPARGNTRET